MDDKTKLIRLIQKQRDLRCKKRELENFVNVLSPEQKGTPVKLEKEKVFVKYGRTFKLPKSSGLAKRLNCKSSLKSDVIFKT